MTNYEKRFNELKQMYKKDSYLEELLDLFVKFKLNQISILNDKGVDTSGLVKEVAGVTALSIEIFTEEAQNNE